MGISTLDPDGYYIRANKAYASMIGYTPAEMIGMSWQKTVPTHSLPQAIRAYQTMLERGQSAVDIEGMRKDRSTFYKQVVLVKKTNHKGDFIGHYCFMKDISQHHQQYNRYDIEETVCNISAYRTLI